ncbi:MAG: InlB B-repeat-containing protein, partial [Clostridiales bacterium]|nr:InlB B-repeat-containing protein [Clostridiales bacterium]
PMSDNGITFIVTAEASGYAPSTSRELTYKRSLNAVTGLAVDESTQTLKWNAVDNATNYIVSIKCGKSDHVHSVVDNGNKLTYSLKECEPCEGGITINVYPKTKGYISPTPTKLIYNKTTLASPSNIRIVGTTIRWDSVANAESYTLRIGNAQKTVDGQTQFDLNELLESWVPEADYKLNIRANGDVNSLWSDDVDMRYYAMYGSVKYERNTVSWRHVIGAQKYEVQLNGKTVAEIENGVNRYEIALNKSGFNTVAVRYYDGADYSAWASINVYAYTVTFDTHQGTVAEPLYVAVGDKVILPTSELEGYELAGWYNTAGGAAANGAKYDDEIFAGTGDMLLHANWKPATYTVKYDFAGGECVAESGSVTFKSHFKLDVPTIADGTKAFAGWYAGPNGGGTRYTDEFGVSIAPWRMPFDSTIYAHWVATLEYTAMSDGTYSVGKGAGIGSVTHVTIPSSYNGKPVSTIAAYAFKNCANLTSLTIPDTVNIIATSSAFSGCSV